MENEEITNEQLIEKMWEFEKNMMENMKDIPSKSVDLINDNLFDLCKD